MRDRRFLMAIRDDGVGQEDAEPVTAEVTEGRLLLVLDDGQTLSLDAEDVAHLIEDAA